MSIRDNEVERIKKYCAGLGIKIILNNEICANDGTWSVDPYEITIYTKNHRSKTHLILSFLHELSHHFYYVHNNKPPIPDAYVLEANRSRKDKPIHKRLRKKIFDYERNSITYLATIATELGLKIPEWKVKYQMEYDTWVYEYYYETGNFPRRDVSRDKRKELKRKHRGL